MGVLVVAKVEAGSIGMNRYLAGPTADLVEVNQAHPVAVLVE